MKAKSTGLLSIIILMASFNANAQIIYTYLQDTVINYPGVPVSGDSTNFYSLDINSDNITDCLFVLKTDADMWQDSYMLSSISNRVIYYENSGYLCTMPLEEGYLISHTSNWNQFNESGIYLSLGGFPVSCDIPFQSEYYGFRFQVNNDMHYGWLNLDVNEIGELVIHGCAYNTIAEEPIFTGQTIGIDNSLNNNTLIVTCVNKQLQIVDNIGGDKLNKVELINLAGENLFSEKIENHRSSINLNGVPTSLYIVKITYENTVKSRLLYVN